MIQGVTPSQVLTGIASLLHELELEVGRAAEIAGWMRDSQITLEGFSEALSAEEWRLGPQEVLEIEQVSKFTGVVGSLTNKEEFVQAVAALQALDRWHAPLIDSSLRSEIYREEYQSLEDAISLGDVIAENDKGKLILSRNWMRPDEDVISAHSSFLDAFHSSDPFGSGIGPIASASILKNYLYYTCYLPVRLRVENPDKKGVIEPERFLTVSYKRHLSGAPAGPRSPAAPLEVGVAPLVEAEGDVEFVVRPCGLKYGMQLTYNKNKIENAINKAIYNGVELLLMPEMSVSEENLEFLCSSIKDQCEKYVIETGDLPSIRYILAGILGQEPAGDDWGSNFVVLINSAGVEIDRQYKIHRWNLNGDQIHRFGIDISNDELPSELIENIEVAKDVHIMDIPDVGRTFILICADNDFNTPGDWLIDNAVCDFLYAPIMDQSTIVRSSGSVGPWISARAHRAACSGHSKVMVTNSISLTSKVNATNMRDGKLDFIFKNCGIALFFDATDEEIQFLHITTEVPSKENVFSFGPWGSGWSSFRST